MSLQTQPWGRGAAGTARCWTAAEPQRLLLGQPQRPSFVPHGRQGWTRPCYPRGDRAGRERELWARTSETGRRGTAALAGLWHIWGARRDWRPWSLLAQGSSRHGGCETPGGSSAALPVPAHLAQAGRGDLGPVQEQGLDADPVPVKGLPWNTAHASARPPSAPGEPQRRDPLPAPGSSPARWGRPAPGSSARRSPMDPHTSEPPAALPCTTGTSTVTTPARSS